MVVRCNQSIYRPWTQHSKFEYPSLKKTTKFQEKSMFSPLNYMTTLSKKDDSSALAASKKTCCSNKAPYNAAFYLFQISNRWGSNRQEYGSKLYLTKSKRTDSGQYTCIATNQIGNPESAQVTLRVQCKYLFFTFLFQFTFS